VPLGTFLAAGPKDGRGVLKRARYGVSKMEHWLKCAGTCYEAKEDSPEAALRRAQVLLEMSESRPYDLHSLTLANCEHVIVWCKSGVWRSCQVDFALFFAGLATLAASSVALSGRRRLLPLLGSALLVRLTASNHDKSHAAFMSNFFGHSKEDASLCFTPPEVDESFHEESTENLLRWLRADAEPHGSVETAAH